MRILLAEDEEQLARVLKMAMTSSNYTVDAVDNGQKAVDLAKENAYDVIILDIMMPVKDGITALKEIRESGNQTYVIMLTAMAEVDDRVNGLDSGADDYITKPLRNSWRACGHWSGGRLRANRPSTLTTSPWIARSR